MMLSHMNLLVLDKVQRNVLICIYILGKYPLWHLAINSVCDHPDSLLILSVFMCRDVIAGIPIVSHRKLNQNKMTKLKKDEINEITNHKL